MAGTNFNKRRKLGILDKDLGSSDVINMFTTEHVTRFTVRRFADLWKDYLWLKPATSILAPGSFLSPPCFVV